MKETGHSCIWKPGISAHCLDYSLHMPDLEQLAVVCLYPG